MKTPASQSMFSNFFRDLEQSSGTPDQTPSSTVDQTPSSWYTLQRDTKQAISHAFLLASLTTIAAIALFQAASPPVALSVLVTRVVVGSVSLATTLFVQRMLITRWDELPWRWPLFCVASLVAGTAIATFVLSIQPVALSLTAFAGKSLFFTGSCILGSALNLESVFGVGESDHRISTRFTMGVMATALMQLRKPETMKAALMLLKKPMTMISSLAARHLAISSIVGGTAVVIACLAKSALNENWKYSWKDYRGPKIILSSLVTGAACTLFAFSAAIIPQPCTWDICIRVIAIVGSGALLHTTRPDEGLWEVWEVDNSEPLLSSGYQNKIKEPRQPMANPI